MGQSGQLLLALETGGEQVAIALYDGGVIGEFLYDAGESIPRQSYRGSESSWRTTGGASATWVRLP